MYIGKYLIPGATYREVAWCAEDGDREDAEASLSRAFRAVSEACESAEILLQQVQQDYVENAVEIPDSTGELKPQEDRAWTVEKAVRLVLLFFAFRLLKRFNGTCSPAWLNLSRYMSRGYTLRQLGFRMSGPHSLKHTLL